MTGINGQDDTVQVGIKVIYDSVLVLQFFFQNVLFLFLDENDVTYEVLLFFLKLIIK